MKQPLTISIITTKRSKSQDAVLWDEVRRIFEGFERTVFAKELKTVFENLCDDELIEKLEKTRWTGRPGYLIKVMWRTVIAGYVLDIPTIEGLRRRLEDPFVAILCSIHSDKEIPSRFAYYRFIKKLIIHKELIERCMAKVVEAFKARLPGFGEIVVIDSTDISSYANKFRKPCADPNAQWGAKSRPDGNKDWWLGYKMHLASTVVGKYEIPLLPIITSANTNDSIMMIPLLEKNKVWLKDFSPKFVLGDKGYDSIGNCRAIIEDFRAIPIIGLRLSGHRAKLGEFEDIADEYGTPYCAWEVPMVFWGYDKRQKRLKYRCPQACGKKGCTWLEKCSESSYGQVVKIRLKDDYRRFIQVPRHTKRWRRLYNMRSSIERVFSGLKKDGDGKLINPRIRGLDKITLNCLLSVWVMQARRLAISTSSKPAL